MTKKPCRVNSVLIAALFLAALVSLSGAPVTATREAGETTFLCTLLPFGFCPMSTHLPIGAPLVPMVTMVPDKTVVTPVPIKTVSTLVPAQPPPQTTPAPTQTMGLQRTTLGVVTTPPIVVTPSLHVKTTLYLTCPGGLTNCNGTCVNLQSDKNNCGSCSTPCIDHCSNGPRKECIEGRCLKDCGHGFIDPETDPDNCVCCGNRCNQMPGGYCSGGCVIDCPGYGKVSPLSDNHCGGCDIRCQVTLNESCRGYGICDCKPGYSRCNGICIETRNDTANCGACGIRCRPDQICYSGQCECDTRWGNRECLGLCVDTWTNIDHCGDCSHSCMGQGANEIPGNRIPTCTYGTCHYLCDGIHDTNLDTDTLNCGICGIRCAAWQNCVLGECVVKTCSGGLSVCEDGLCYDTTSDKENCGICGRRCDWNQYCINSQCLDACPPGTADCYHNGECVNLMTGGYEASHCGSCDHNCYYMTEVCYQGNCVSTCPQGYTSCNMGSCVNLNNDKNNCGTCNFKCTGTQKCEDGACNLPCPDPNMKHCNGICSDVMFSRENCGTCGSTCGTVCLFGICLW